MFPKKYFPRKYFTQKYWPPIVGILEYILHPVKFFYRSVVQVLFNDIVVEQTFACSSIQTDFTINRKQTVFIDSKVNTPLVAEKRNLIFYDSRPARS
ncbi:MAG: hypothetical protein DRP09_16010 [Candidatus Thorarchaeota archaeon]|nr:MAG: hypothetical protein DRP09_16010 [Candidatus Thorarchaeota archaeon]